MNLITQTRNWLRSNHILVPDDWLQACVEFLQEENQGRSLVEDVVVSQVYEQWLLADLHELETQCLPQELSHTSKFELSGAFALQIDSLLDVGVSFYSQQQKVKGTENPNVNVTAEEASEKPWEQKPSRMLMMKLTDGKQLVQGMEYRPISCLNSYTPPGTKVLIHGNVLCRHGVLMLASNNVKLLGGEVDTLVESVTVMNMLQTAMAASHEHEGKEHHQTFAGSEVRNTKKSLLSLQTSDRTTFGKASTKDESHFPASCGGGIIKVSHTAVKTEVKSQHTKVPSAVMSYSSANVGSENKNNYQQLYDEFMDDLDDEFLEEMEVDRIEPVPREQAITSTIGRKSASEESRDTMVPLIEKVFSAKHHTAQVSNKVTPTTGKLEVAESTPTIKAAVNVASASTNHNRSDNFVDTGFQFSTSFPPVDEEIDFLETSGNNFVYNSSSDEKSRKVQSRANEFLYKNKQNIPINSAIAKEGKAGDRLIKFGQQTIDNKSAAAEVIPSLGKVSRNRVTDADINTESRDMTVSNQRHTKGSTIPLQNVMQTIVSSENNVGKQQTQTCIGGDNETMKHGHVEMFEDYQNEYPFTYLAKVMSQPSQNRPVYHTVKAFISTLTSKLTFSNDKWSLSCKINDGTMAIDADLSNQVLTGLIGFSCAEAQEMKKRVKIDPKIKEVLLEGIQQCQQKLIELVCLLELEISVSNPRPVIVATKQLTTHHMDLLYNRVMTNWDKL